MLICITWKVYIVMMKQGCNNLPIYMETFAGQNFCGFEENHESFL